MMKLEIVVVMLVVILVSRCSGLGSGAPSSVCATMIPGHGVNAQITDPPYNITVSSTSYTLGGTLQVTVAGADSKMYGGVFVQARVKNCNESLKNAPQGTFTLANGESELKLVTCNGTESAVTHTSPDGKTTKTFTWNAPATDMGTIHFLATVAESRDLFWTEISSDSITSPSNNSCPTVDSGNPSATPPTVLSTTMGANPIDTSFLFIMFCAVISLLGFY